MRAWRTAVVACLLGGCGGDHARPGPIVRAPIAIAPLPAEFPADEATLTADRDRADVVAMRRHAWSLWLAINAPTATGALTWETWVRADRLFATSEARGAVPPNGLRFRVPHVAAAPSSPLDPSPPPLSFVMFDRETADHIAAHGLASRAALEALAAVPGTRAIPPFPRGAVALKLVWYPVHRAGLTAVPVWDGEPTRADDAGNGAPTWSRVVAVDPTLTDVDPAHVDAARDRDAIVLFGGRAVRAHRVPLARFYQRVLVSDDEARSARAASGDATIQVGDHVALVAVHVTTKELPDWTWATFWWHDRADAGPFAADRPAAVPGAFRNYLMDATDGADAPREPDGAPRVCFNPWVEGRFPGGLHSNCVACHQRAVLGADDFLPVTRGLTAPDDPYLADRMATDFMWSIALEAR